MTVTRDFRCGRTGLPLLYIMYIMWSRPIRYTNHTMPIRYAMHGTHIAYLPCTNLIRCLHPMMYMMHTVKR